MEHLFLFPNGQLRVVHYSDPNPGDAPLNMHTHDMLEIYYLIAGSGQFMVECGTYMLKPGDVVIIRSAEAHCAAVESAVPCEYLNIHFTPSYFGKFLPEYRVLLAPFFQHPPGLYNLYSSDLFPSGHWHSCLDAITAALKECPHPEMYIEANLFAFLTELNVAYEHRNLSMGKSDSTELTSQIIDYITDNLFMPISVQSISQRFHISQTHLNRIVKKATGSSVWNYIRSKRLIEARRQICLGVPALEASRDCGFGDYSAFFRAYKSQFSSTPQEDFSKAKRTE